MKSTSFLLLFASGCLLASGCGDDDDNGSSSDIGAADVGGSDLGGQMPGDGGGEPPIDAGGQTPADSGPREDGGSAPSDTGTSADAEPRCGPVPASPVSLQSIMDPQSTIVEFDFTGSLASIGRGDGSDGDADGLYDADTGTVLLGTEVDVFPAETEFQVGSLAFDATGGSGCGEESFTVTSLNLGGLWARGSEESDISDTALRLWFLEAPLALTFGALDVDDSVSFRDGVLVSIDVERSFDVDIDYSFGAGDSTTYSGNLIFEGARVRFEIDDTQIPDTQGLGPDQSRLVVTLTGTVSAVASEAGP